MPVEFYQASSRKPLPHQLLLDLHLPISEPDVLSSSKVDRFLDFSALMRNTKVSTIRRLDWFRQLLLPIL